MRIIDAIWEKRNLNRSVMEFELDKDDQIQSLDTITKDINDYDYVIARIPKGKMDIIHHLEDNGFRFMESLIELSFNLNKLTESSRFVKRLTDQLSISKIDTEEKLMDLLSKIDVDLFNTDRISLDPQLGIEFAHIRYINWLKDGFNQGAHIYEVVYKSRGIGFFYCTRIDDNNVYVALSTVYQKYQNKGFGLSVFEKIIISLKDFGYKKIMTKVSTNNLEALRVNLNLGFETKDIYYILRKINDK